MTLQPLLSASPQIILHAFAAMLALVLGIVQIAGPKGTFTHRTIGWGWVITMTVVALSSFWIHGIRQFGDFSWIHILSIVVLVTLPLAVLAARRHQVTSHRNRMLSVFVGGLLIAGVFTLVPGRIMHDVVFPRPAGQQAAAR